jgi:hypothetical protein
MVSSLLDHLNLGFLGFYLSERLHSSRRLLSFFCLVIAAFMLNVSLAWLFENLDSLAVTVMSASPL